MAGRTALLEVPLDGGDRGDAPDGRLGRARRARCRWAACAHGAWASPVGSLPAAVRRRGRRGQRPRGHVERGRARVPGEPAGRRAQRHAARPPVDAPAGHRPAGAELDDSRARGAARRGRGGDRRASDTTQDLVTECTAESAPPTAADDEFGVRPGRTTILPVIDNDSSSDCGILVVSEFDPLPAEFGTRRGDLRRTRAPGGRRRRAPPGTAELTYTITDGRGHQRAVDRDASCLTVRDAVARRAAGAAADRLGAGRAGRAGRPRGARGLPRPRRRRPAAGRGDGRPGGGLGAVPAGRLGDVPAPTARTLGPQHGDPAGVRRHRRRPRAALDVDVRPAGSAARRRSTRCTP